MKLHGLQISNYYNVIKLGLLEKGLEFEEVQAKPHQEEPFLSMSPMGKIPVLEDQGYHISETMAILRYLDLKYPAKPLYPSDPLLAARAQQVHSIADLYVDTPARTLLRAAFFGGEATPEAIAEVSGKLARAARALEKLMTFKPFAVGSDLSHADLAAVTTLPLATQIMTRLGEPDPFANVEGLAAYDEMMATRPTLQKVRADRMIAIAAVMGA